MQSLILQECNQSSRNEDHLRLHEQSQPNGNTILQGTCWIHLLLDFQVQFLKVVADCRLLKHLLYSLQITTATHMDPLVKLTASDCSDSISVMNNKEVIKVKCLLGRLVFSGGQSVLCCQNATERKRPLERWKVCGNSQRY